jgi:putative Mg2+ transporter-C (MgtC) family protein
LVGSVAAVVVAMGYVMDINARYGDPTRAMHGIITGIGFLGAGLIFTNRGGGVQGLTTAATIFATAGMGCAVGLGFQLAAVGFTIIILVVLRSTQFLEVTVRRPEKSEDKSESR